MAQNVRRSKKAAPNSRVEVLRGKKERKEVPEPQAGVPSPILEEDRKRMR